MRRTLLLLSLVSIAVCLDAAGDAALDRATMRGVKSVNVVIDHIDPQLPKEGVTAAVLQARLEAKLKEAGLAVDPAAAEFVGIQVTAVRAAKGPYAVAYTIGLYQSVSLRRDPSVRTVTKTWEVETILMSDAKSLMRASIESVDDLAARFATAYQSVNPK